MIQLRKIMWHLFWSSERMFCEQFKTFFFTRPRHTYLLIQAFKQFMRCMWVRYSSTYFSIFQVLSKNVWPRHITWKREDNRRPCFILLKTASLLKTQSSTEQSNCTMCLKKLVSGLMAWIESKIKGLIYFTEAFWIYTWRTKWYFGFFRVNCFFYSFTQRSSHLQFQRVPHQRVTHFNFWKYKSTMVLLFLMQMNAFVTCLSCNCSGVFWIKSCFIHSFIFRG